MRLTLATFALVRKTIPPNDEKLRSELGLNQRPTAVGRWFKPARTSVFHHLVVSSFLLRQRLPMLDAYSTGLKIMRLCPLPFILQFL
ncbi:hypothetical protein HOLleu_07499 [Holothuria leucospilota]|uniref:Uncharacterized protein n=1 Tax=Holothuria leucospilota TaxID=206669 RepID=A0A9Q1CG37_HOLLE|nr:hypothetical protein HOLleu_07499 [Holothuria leucospilota]